MKTEFRQNTLEIARRSILAGFICAMGAFTTFNAVSSTNTVQVNIKARFVQLQPGSDWREKMDWFMLARLTNRGPTFTANLTSSQFQNVLEKLDHHDGADLVNEGQVTTITGRQAQFQVVDGSATVDTNTGTVSVTNSTGESMNVDPKNTPFGTTLDVVPNASEDGSKIEMVLIPTITQFLGINQSGAFFPPSMTNAAGTSIGLMLPHSRVRQMTLNTSVKDGQTLVLADFSGKPNGIMGTNLLIFVTPTLVDSFGHRIHSGDYYDGPRPRGGGFGGGGFRDGPF